MKRILTVVILLLCLALALGLSSCKGKSEKNQTPLDILKDVMEKTAASYKNDSSALWEKALSGGSIEYAVTYGEDMPLKSLTAKNFYGKDKAVATLLATAASGETLDLTAYSDAKSMILSSSLFDDNYSLTRSALFDLLREMMDSEQSSLTDLAGITQLCEAVFLPIGDKADVIIMKHIDVEITSAESSMTIDLHLSSQSLVSMIEDLTELIRNDQKLMDTIVSRLDDIITEEVTPAVVFNFMSELTFRINRGQAYIADLRFVCSNDRIMQRATVTVYEQKDHENVGDRLLALSVALPENGGFDIELEIKGETIEIEHKVDEDNYQRKDTLSIGARGMTFTPVSLIYHKADRTYKLTVEIPSLFKLTAKGSYTASNAQAVITMNEINLAINDDTSSSFATNVSVTLTVKAKDTMPKAPTDYTDITTLSEEKVDELKNTLMENDVVLTIVEMLSVFANFGEEESLLPVS